MNIFSKQKKIFPHFTITTLLIGSLYILPQVASAATVSIKFMTHIQAGMPEQDVFIGRSNISGDQVARVEPKDINTSTLNSGIFAASVPVPHDPFKVGLSPLGPFPQGKYLGLSLKQWLAATGYGSYTISGNNAELKVFFQKLIPGGLYSVWCSRLTFPPSPQMIDRPCGAEDGSQNSFTADGNGAGMLILNMKPLEASTAKTASVIAAAYHSDNVTHGSNPGDFGLNSHVQLFFLIPSSGAATAPAPTATPNPATKTPAPSRAPSNTPLTTSSITTSNAPVPPTTSPSGKSALTIIAVVIVLAAAGWTLKKKAVRA